MNSKNVFFMVAILSIILFSGIILIQSDSSPIEETAIGSQIQTVKLYVEGGSYVFEPSEFTVGRTVKIVADVSRIPGCAKSIVIPAFGIQKTVTTQNNIIIFTPRKTGTFTIACSMNMYKGVFTVA